MDEFIAGLVGALAVIIFGGFLTQMHFMPAIHYWQAVGATLLIQIIGGSFKAWTLDLNKETK